MITELIKNRLKLYIRKIEDSGKEANDKKYRLIRKKIFIFAFMIIFFLIVGTIYILVFVKAKDDRKINRPKVGESATDVRLLITDGDREKEYDLNVSASIYSEEEFNKLSNAAFKMAEDMMQGDNTDLSNVSKNLLLPERDSSNTLYFNWNSDNPGVLNGNGEVNNEELTEEISVILTAEISDDTHLAKKEYLITVVPESYQKGSFKEAVDILQKEEKKNRESGLFILPDKESGINVKKKTVTKIEMICKLFIFTFLGIFVAAGFVIEGMKEKIRKRDAELKASYYGFVNKLQLLIGAGLSVKKALLMAADNETKYLRHEIEICINRIEAGESERNAYTDMGREIGISEYIKLTSLISQNISYGNSNLLSLLENEEKETYFRNKEEIRKKSEQISTKLLIPILILLLAVIAILMIPALMSMK